MSVKLLKLARALSRWSNVSNARSWLLHSALAIPIATLGALELWLLSR